MNELGLPLTSHSCKATAYRGDHILSERRGAIATRLGLPLTSHSWNATDVN